MPMNIGPTGWTAIGGVIIAAVTGFFAWVKGRHSSVAVLQTALVAGFKELNDQRIDAMNTMQNEIQLLKLEATQFKMEMAEVRGELAQEKQKTNALKNILRANGLEIPRETVTAVVFSPYPDTDIETQEQNR